MSLRSRKKRPCLILWILMLCLVPVNLMGCDHIPFAPFSGPLPDLIRVRPDKYPMFDDDMDFKGLAESMDQSLGYLANVPENRQFVFGKDVFDARHMRKSMAYFTAFIKSGPSTEGLNRFIASHYRVYRSKGLDRKKQVLFTGYYEPAVPGSPVRTDIFCHGVYSRPDDLVVVDASVYGKEQASGPFVGQLSGGRVLPYPERKAITGDPGFYKKAAPLAWVADPVALFFLHVQGSGKIVFEDGSFVRVQYDASNGRPYRSIGRYLIDQGAVSEEEMSMQAIAAYLKSHPAEVASVLNLNPSFIFFRQAQDGPYGSIQARLVPGRAIASDRQVFPPSALAFIQTRKPRLSNDGDIEAWVPLARFVLNQDTGSAIKGPGRVDLFWGSGPYAEVAAGHQKHAGTLYFLILDPDLT